MSEFRIQNSEFSTPNGQPRITRRPLALNSVLFAVFTSALSAQPIQSRTLRWEGLERTFTVRVPRSADTARAMPLVILLHGRGGSGQGVAQRTGFTAIADTAGFLLVAPDGTGEPRGWHTGFAPGGAVNDVGFINALIDTLAARYRIDQKRVYVAGYSNGGVLAHRVAADLSRRIAAAAVYAGAIGVRTVRGDVSKIDPPRGPVPIMIIHGDADDVVPYDTTRGHGRMGGYPVPAPDAARYWARANECRTMDPRRDTVAAGRVLHDIWDRGCRAPVEFLTLRGHDHRWPSTRDGAAIEAADAMVEFFTRHRR